MNHQRTSTKTTLAIQEAVISKHNIYPVKEQLRAKIMACNSETERALYVLSARSVCRDIAKGNIPAKVKRIDALIFDKANEILKQRSQWKKRISSYKEAASAHRAGRAARQISAASAGRGQIGVDLEDEERED